MTANLALARRYTPSGHPPVIVRIHPKVFEDGHAVLRFASQVPQGVFAKLREAAEASVYADGTVVVVGYAPAGTLKDYRANLGQRRAEAVKAAIGGDPAGAEATLAKHLATEGLAKEGGWTDRDADQLLELVLPPELATAERGPRIQHFQREEGLPTTGLADPETLKAIVRRVGPLLARGAWKVPQRIYSATSIETARPGGVEVWVFAESGPPDGTPWTWRGRGPVVEMFPYQDALEDARGNPAPSEEAMAEVDAELKALDIQPAIQDPPPDGP